MTDTGTKVLFIAGFGPIDRDVPKSRALYADSLGITKVLDDLHRFTESAGPLYTPCTLIRDMAKSGKRFYED